MSSYYIYYPPKSEHEILNTRDMISSLLFPRKIPLIIIYVFIILLGVGPIS